MPWVDHDMDVIARAKRRTVVTVEMQVGRLAQVMTSFIRIRSPGRTHSVGPPYTPL